MSPQSLSYSPTQRFGDGKAIQFALISSLQFCYWP